MNHDSGQYLIWGAAVGFVESLLWQGLVLSTLLEWSGRLALILIVATTLAAPFIVYQAASGYWYGPVLRGTTIPINLNYFHLQTVSILTFLFPLFGASFGAPNLEIPTLLSIVGLATIGGAAWSIPFEIWHRRP